MKPLPPEAIVDDALMNSTAIVQAIQELIGELRIKQKEIAIGVSGHSVIIKKIQMPQMTQEELDESIQWEAEQYIPFDVKDVNIDTQILSTEAIDRDRADGRAAGRGQEGHDQRLHHGGHRGGAARRWWWTSTPSRSRTCSARTTSIARRRDGGADQRRRLGGEHQHPRPRA